MTRFGYILVTHFSVVTFSALNFISVTPKLIWNASASEPIGLYRVQAVDHPAVGDIAVIMPPEGLAEFLASRSYLPLHVPLLKTVTATAGQTVCRSGSTITVDGTAIGEALDRDRLGRDLPVWTGCNALGSSEIFVMNSHVHDSLDGRYFGSLSTNAVIGRAIPVWTESTAAAASQLPPTEP